MQFRLAQPEVNVLLRCLDGKEKAFLPGRRGGLRRAGRSGEVLHPVGVPRPVADAGNADRCVFFIHHVGVMAGRIVPALGHGRRGSVAAGVTQDILRHVLLFISGAGRSCSVKIPPVRPGMAKGYGTFGRTLQSHFHHGRIHHQFPNARFPAERIEFFQRFISGRIVNFQIHLHRNSGSGPYRGSQPHT